MHPYRKRSREFTKRLWMERAIFGAIILILLTVQISGALGGRRGIISVDGGEVAVVKNASEARKVIDSVLGRMSQGCDGKVQFAEKVVVTVEKRPQERVMSRQVAEAKLEGTVHIGGKLWVICVDGQPVLALDSQEKANKTLALYATQNGGEDIGPSVAPTQFAQQVTVEQRLVPLSIAVSTPEGGCERLNGGQKKHVFHVVKEGETAYEIAHRYKMGYFDLKDLNPGKNLDRLKIGDKLTISASEPVITVVSTRRASLSESIDFPVRVVKSSGLYKDQQVTKQHGQLGRRTVDAIVTVVNGKIVDREVLKAQVSRRAIAQVVAVGTRSRPSGQVMMAYGGRGQLRGEQAARRIFLMYRHGNQRGRFRGVYGMSELGVDVGTAHSLNHAFGAHYTHGLSWQTVVSYLERGDRSFGGRWGCAGGPHNPRAAARWIRANVLK